MSIVTKKGDQGMTSLIYKRPVGKTDLRLEVCGTIDELNSSLGMVRATATDSAVSKFLLQVQNNLIAFMGEVACLPEDRTQYLNDGYAVVTPEMTDQLDQLINRIEPICGHPNDWVLPGATVPSAALDMARTIARRAERRVCELHKTDPLQNPQLTIYLNRLSDTLWLLGRWLEAGQPHADEILL